MEDSSRRELAGPILIVDDDVEMTAFCQHSLEAAGFICMTAGTARAASYWLNQPMLPKLILLDHRLPDADGITFVQELRATDCKDIPIIMLTASSDNETRIAARAAGIELFLTKPVLAEHLCEAAKQVFRLAESKIFDVLTLDPQNRVASYGGRRVRLSGRLFELVALLGEHYPRSVERRRLTEDIGRTNRDREVDVLVSLLRKQLREGLRINPIETVPCVGYRLTVPTRKQHNE